MRAYVGLAHKDFVELTYISTKSQQPYYRCIKNKASVDNHNVSLCKHNNTIPSTKTRYLPSNELHFLLTTSANKEITTVIIMR